VLQKWGAATLFSATLIQSLNQTNVRFGLQADLNACPESGPLSGVERTWPNHPLLHRAAALAWLIRLTTGLPLLKARDIIEI